VEHDRPLSTKDVADLFGVSQQTVGNWAKSGKLPSFSTPGGRLRFRPEDVEALYESAQLTPENAA
jgi:excisionase family DNA binding protein